MRKPSEVWQEALTIVCGNWDAINQDLAHKTADELYNDITELVARIVTDIQARAQTEE